MADGSLYPPIAAPARRPRLLGESAEPETVAEAFPVELPEPPAAIEREASRPAVRPTLPAVEHCQCCRCRQLAHAAAPTLLDDAQSRMAFGFMLMVGTLIYLHLIA